jgi:thiamine biosynthesis lipoprotein
MTGLSRRRFLSLLAAGGLCAAGSFVCPPPALAGAPGRRAVTRILPAMSTFVQVTAVHESADAAEAAIAAAFAAVTKLEAELTRFDPASPLSALNASGRLTDVPPALATVLSAGLAFHGATGGAFDPTILPLIDCLAQAAALGRPLDPADPWLAQARALVGADAVRLGPGRAELARDGARLTLDGLAKGYIVDAASQAMTAAGVPDHLVNAGGDLAARGRRADGRPWSVAVENPRTDGGYPAVTVLSGAALATSGRYEQPGHILDPRLPLAATATPAAQSVTVRAPTCLEADALATALVVLPPAEGLALVDSLPGRACLYLGAGGAKLASRAWA